MIQLKVRLFGALRKYGDGSMLNLEVPRGSRLSQVRARLGEMIGNPELVSECAFADESTILSDETVMERDSTVAVLPPVCGG